MQIINITENDMNLEFLDFCKEQQVKIPLNTFKIKGKYNRLLVNPLRELFVSGDLYPRDYCDLFCCASHQFVHNFLRSSGPVLNQQEIQRIYGARILETNKRTCVFKYGVPYSFQSQNHKDKTRETSLRKYGVDHPNKFKPTREKQRETLKRNFGVDVPLKCPEIRSRAAATFKSNFTPEISEKRIQTNKNRFGVENPMQNPNIKSKHEATCIVKYGVTSPLAIKENRDARWLGTRTQKLRDMLANPDNYTPEEKFKFAKQNYISSQFYPVVKMLDVQPDRGSSEEYIMKDLLDSMKIEYIHHYYPRWLNGQELDFLIKINENYSVAVEVNGVAWHSSNKAAKGDPKDPEYHINKRLACQHQGVKLLGFMDFEINDPNKREFIKDTILKAIQNPWNDEKLALMRNSSRDQYIVNSFEYDGWVYYDYGTFKS